MFFYILYILEYIFVKLPKTSCLFQSDILHTNLCQFYLLKLHKHLTYLNLHLKLSSLGSFGELERFRKVINRIYKIRYRPNQKLLLKLDSDRIRISI